MATVGHVAVGLVTARALRRGRRPEWPLALGWSALALLPDADVIAFAFGEPYQSQWGHRGFTHSFSMALALGLVAWLVAKRFNHAPARTALWASLAVASHGILDAMSDGGLGCALLWPFDVTRYFAPWTPIPVAPIGLAMLSPHGAIVVLVELALFAALLYVALRPDAARPRRLFKTAFAGLWIVSTWLFSSKDPVRESVAGFLLRDRTEFTAGFSESAFRSLREGLSSEDVLRLLGPPHGEGWFYPPPLRGQAAKDTAAASLTECRSIRSERRFVVMAYDPEACRAIGIQPGTPLDEVSRLLGTPREQCWQYSWSSGLALRLRMVCFDDAGVDDVIRGWTMSE
jgi:inner membrane protein